MVHPSSLIHQNFRYPKFSDRRKGSPTTFSVLWDKNFDKNCDTTPSSLNHNIFRYQKFSETQKGCPTNFFGTVRQKLGKKSWQTPSSLIHKNFRYPKFSETKEGSPSEFFGTVRQWLWQKIEIQPPLLSSITFSDTRILLNYRRVAPRHFSVQWDKNLEKKPWQPPSLLIKKNSKPEIFETPMCFRTKFFGTVEQKKYQQIIVKSPYYP